MSYRDCSIERVKDWEREYFISWRVGFSGGIANSSIGLISARLDWVTMGVL